MVGSARFPEAPRFASWSPVYRCRLKIHENTVIRPNVRSAAYVLESTAPGAGTLV